MFLEPFVLPTKDRGNFFTLVFELPSPLVLALLVVASDEFAGIISSDPKVEYSLDDVQSDNPGLAVYEECAMMSSREEALSTVLVLSLSITSCLSLLHYEAFNFSLAHTIALVTAYSEFVKGLRTTDFIIPPQEVEPYSYVAMAWRSNASPNHETEENVTFKEFTHERCLDAREFLDVEAEVSDDDGREDDDDTDFTDFIDDQAISFSSRKLDVLLPILDDNENFPSSPSISIYSAAQISPIHRLITSTPALEDAAAALPLQSATPSECWDLLRKCDASRTQVAVFSSPYASPSSVSFGLGSHTIAVVPPRSAAPVGLWTKFCTGKVPCPYRRKPHAFRQDVLKYKQQRLFVPEFPFWVLLLNALFNAFNLGTHTFPPFSLISLCAGASLDDGLDNGLDTDLPEKALFHPYTRPAKPQKIDIPPTLCDSSPGSPLTPLGNEPSNGSSTVSSSACRIIFIPPPLTGVTVLTAGWSPDLLKSYRSFARDAVKAHLDYSKSLSTQIPKAVEQAQQYIEDKIPLFKNHQDHWGANALLRDQLKSNPQVPPLHTQRRRINARDVLDVEAKVSGYEIDDGEEDIDEDAIRVHYRDETLDWKDGIIVETVSGADGIRVIHRQSSTKTIDVPFNLIESFHERPNPARGKGLMVVARNHPEHIGKLVRRIHHFYDTVKTEETLAHGAEGRPLRF
ncbi:hypothetical protein BDP27DRAFT_1428274 [Rhodocollybia butyracea]|uniref:Uncharacterized protein n=1 Tax=Rhodocollybia butyracea TaxID=206335 RepID=A0A9P5U1Y5_9AGAR|nr:hypothetical protein BDP27DRAFT_1428274 [Rhodocollybia butyracea]